MNFALQRSFSDLNQCLHDDGDNNRLEAVEYCNDDRLVSVGCVHVRKNEQNEDRRDYEEGSGNNSADGAMHQPADVDRKLMSFGSRQEHAVVEGMKKSLVAEPPAFVDKLAMHDRNLPGRTAERDEAQLHPEP